MGVGEADVWSVAARTYQRPVRQFEVIVHDGRGDGRLEACRTSGFGVGGRMVNAPWNVGCRSRIGTRALRRYSGV
jgi:hypothetical protein